MKNYLLSFTSVFWLSSTNVFIETFIFDSEYNFVYVYNTLYYQISSFQEFANSLHGQISWLSFCLLQEL